MLRKKKRSILLIALAVVVVAIGAALAVAAFKGRSYYSPEKAAEYASKHAQERSIKRCAGYVRLAMQNGGGIYLVGWPQRACDYFEFLPVLGFEEVNEPYQNGDIAVFDATENHIFGHIAIYYNGKWYSDFKQRGFYVASEYRNARYAIFRKAAGKQNSNVFKQLWCLTKMHASYIVIGPSVLWKYIKEN